MEILVIQQGQENSIVKYHFNFISQKLKTNISILYSQEVAKKHHFLADQTICIYAI